MQTKQVLVVRKDLNMRKGKIAAQCAHASMAVLLNLFYKGSTHNDDNEPVDQMWMMNVKHDSPLQHWLNGSFTKVCVSVNSEEELLAIHQAAKDAGVLTSLITDNGLTEFHGVPTNTVVAVGPDSVEKINAITGKLSLL